MRLHHKKFLFCVLLIFSLVLTAPSNLASEDRLKFEADFSLSTDYLWRGLVINDECVFQPSFTLTKPLGQSGSLLFNVWGNFDLTDFIATKNKFSEIDFIASYNLSIGTLRFQAGIIHYTFPNTDSEATSEIFLSTSYALEKIPLTLTLTGYYDFDEIEGFYGSVSLDSVINLSDRLSLELQISAGFGNPQFNLGYFGLSRFSFVDGFISSVWNYAFSELLSVSVGAHYLYLFNDSLQNTVSGTDKQKFTGSLGIRYRF